MIFFIKYLLYIYYYSGKYYNMVYIYILRLKSEKYYIGKSEKPKIRLRAHFKSNGATWTKKYKPIEIIETIPDCDHYDEDKYTLKYMKKFGINNVRGGSFCSIILSDEILTIINKMINSVENNCFICNGKGHFQSKCIYNLKFRENNLPTKDEYSNYINHINNYISINKHNLNLIFDLHHYKKHFSIVPVNLIEFYPYVEKIANNLNYNIILQNNQIKWIKIKKSFY